MDKNKETIEEIKRHVVNFRQGYLKGEMGYRFNVHDMLSVIFLYKNSVDPKNPDILGLTNKNTFITKVKGVERKIFEQIKIDLKDINFSDDNQNSLARFIVKSANEKMLKDNRYIKELKRATKNGIAFGSGYLKSYFDSKGVLKWKNVSPTKLIFDINDFQTGIKTEVRYDTVLSIIENKNFDPEAISKFIDVVTDKDLDNTDRYKLYYSLKPIKFDSDGNVTKSEYTITSIEDEILFYKAETNKIKYFKWDFEERLGFKDSNGIGIYETLFNEIVQIKTGRARLDRVMEIVSRVGLQKKIDGKVDKNVGKSVLRIKPGTVTGYRENKIESIDYGGGNQFSMLKAEIQELDSMLSNNINIGDALAGNTLPSGTTGKLGNLLTQNASSVHKETQKNLAQMIREMYYADGIPYFMGIIDKQTNLKKFLSPTDIKTIKRNVLPILLAEEQKKSLIDGKDFDEEFVMSKIKKDFDNGEIIPGKLLDDIKGDIKSITVIITGDSKSNLTSRAFFADLSNQYASNPELFSDPKFIAMKKTEAKYEPGVSLVEVEQILEDDNL